MTEESLITLGGATWRNEETTNDGETNDGETNDLEASVEEANENESKAIEARSDNDVYGPGDDESEMLTQGLSPVNIRNFSVKCGSCGNYQVIVGFRQVDEDWNEYVYECDEPPCSGDVERSRTVLEIPSALDEYASRDPNWHGGEVHAGAKHGSDE